jgi:hypothetical protein
MKTLDINAKEWFDKVNGNSYFSAQIVIDYDLPTYKKYFLPFQYGYGDSFQWQSLKHLQEIGEIDKNIGHLWQLRDNGVIIRTSKRNALKRELKEENF